jgi:hypothetical protein
MTHTCNVCNVNKPEIDFAKSDTKRGYRYECKDCYNAKRKSADYRSKFRKYEHARYQTIEGRLVYLIRNARLRAKKKGREFNIDHTYLLELYNNQNGKCAKTGRSFVFETDGIENRSKDGPSLDRIDSSLGYIKGNVQLVTYHYNVAKSSFTEADLLELAKDILNGRYTT